MKKTNLLKSILLLCALVVGSMNGWAIDTKTEGFETATAGNDYQSIVTVTTAKSDCGISWEIYYGTVSTSSKITGNNSAALRLYSSGSNYGYLKTTTAINDLRKVSFKAKAATSNSAKIKVNIYSSANGSSWTIMKDAEDNDLTDVEFGSSAATYSYDIPQGDKYFKIEISSKSTKPTTKNAQLTIDDVEFEYGTYDPSSAIDAIPVATITYSGGTLTDGVWTMTDNDDYTFQSTTDGKSLGKRSGKTYFKLEYPADYKITVPTGVAVSKVAITGYSTNTSTGTDVTFGATTKTIKTEATYFFDIASPSAGADVTFSTANKEMDIISIVLYTAGGKTITTTANMNGWRAFYDASQDYQVDANTTVYVVKAKSGTENTIELVDAEVTKVKAGTPVILKTAAVDNQLVLTNTTGAAAIASNLLAVTDGSNNVDGYRLGYGDISGENAVGFFKYTTTTAPAAGIVYIDKSNVNTTSARGLEIIFADENPTAIKTVNAEKQLNAPRKVMKDGRIVVETNEGMFSLTGARVK